MNFKDYIKLLTDFEILVIHKYRLEELNNSNKILIEYEIQMRELSVDDFPHLLKKQKEHNKGNTRCPRCHSVKITPEQNLYDSFRGFYSLYLLAPWLLKFSYTCSICNKKFKKWPTIKQIFTL